MSGNLMPYLSRKRVRKMSHQEWLQTKKMDFSVDLNLLVGELAWRGYPVMNYASRLLDGHVRYLLTQKVFRAMMRSNILHKEMRSVDFSPTLGYKQKIVVSTGESTHTCFLRTPEVLGDFWDGVQWDDSWTMGLKNAFTEKYLGCLLTNQGELIPLWDMFGHLEDGVEEDLTCTDEESLEYLRGLPVLDFHFLTNAEYGPLVQEYASERWGLKQDFSRYDFKRLSEFMVRLSKRGACSDVEASRNIFTRIVNKIPLDRIVCHDSGSGAVSLFWNSEGTLCEVYFKNPLEKFSFFIEGSRYVVHASPGKWSGRPLMPIAPSEHHLSPIVEFLTDLVEGAQVELKGYDRSSALKHVIQDASDTTEMWRDRKSHT